MLLKPRLRGLISTAIISFILVSAIASYAGTTNYYYDDLNRLERVEYEDGTIIEYFYDDVGNRTQRAIYIFPEISVSPASHDYGSVNGGATSSQTFTVSNVGSTSLVIDLISLTGTDASEFNIQNDNCSGQTLIPSTACTVDTVFSPASQGAKSANLSIQSNDPDTPILNVALMGTGIQYTLTVDNSGTGTGKGAVTSDVAGINCGSDCTEIYNPGTQVILTPQPDAISAFTGWSGDCTGSGNCVLTMDSDKSVTATFDILPPVADFTGSPTTGTIPFSINFTDNSLRASSWLWNFGDGSFSTEQNPSYAYKSTGTYTVTLTVTNPGGSDQEVKTDYITVQPCTNQPVRIVRATPAYYSTLQAAYDAAADGETIQSQSVNFTEDLHSNRNISVTFEGGYNCEYTANTEKTILNGTMTVSDGIVTIEGFILQ